MKTLLLALVLGFVPMMAQAQGMKMPAFKWSSTVHDFGKIPKGVPVTAEFAFTNTGKGPLTVTNVQGSCGCTVPDYTKEVVAPGKQGVVKATFNAAAVGPFSKTVTVTSNVEGPPVILTIKGEVLE